MEKIINIEEWTKDDFVQYFGDAYICIDDCDDEYNGYIREVEKSREVCLAFRERCEKDDRQFSMSLASPKAAWTTSYMWLTYGRAWC